MPNAEVPHPEVFLIIQNQADNPGVLRKALINELNPGAPLNFYEKGGDGAAMLGAYFGIVAADGIAKFPVANLFNQFAEHHPYWAGLSYSSLVLTAAVVGWQGIRNGLDRLRSNQQTARDVDTFLRSELHIDRA